MFPKTTRSSGDVLVTTWSKLIRTIGSDLTTSPLSMTWLGAVVLVIGEVGRQHLRFIEPVERVAAREARAVRRPG